MTTNLADVIVHIDETLPPDELKTIEKHLHEMQGVVSACNRENQQHLISVVYDPAKLKSQDILKKVQVEGIHAELVGL
jgi:hypothetical protein